MASIGISLRLATLVAGAGGGAPDPATRPDPSPPDDPTPPPPPDPDPDPGPSPDWPDDAVALWLILGQSNAEGYAPWRQDPAQSDPAAAVAALSGAERAFHPWMRLTNRATAASIAQGNGQTVGQFPASGQGLATDGFPRTSGKVWGETLGMPAGTQCFGPEIGLVRHVLDGDAPAGWRDDADPRLYLFKQVEGGQSVDHFRWGGPGQAIVLNALRQSGGENLETLAAAKTVLLQGVIFVIGEKDANDVAPTGGSMAATLAERFADWVRQLRGALGQDLPVAFCETYDAVDVDKAAANAALASLAASLPNAAVIESTAEWTHIGDHVHYDAQGQDRLGRAAFGHIRDAHGRAGDGLVTDFPFTGIKPWFHVPPVFIDDLGGQMKIACTPSATGAALALVTAPDAPAPDAAAIAAAVDGGDPAAFSRSVVEDQEQVWFSGNPARFSPDTTADVHFALRASDGTLGEVATVRRAGGVKFNPDLALASTGSTTASATLTPRYPGDVSWALHEGDRDVMRGEDVEAMAFGPVQAGVRTATAGAADQIDLTGLTSGTTYTLFATARRASDGLLGLTQKIVFTTS